MAKIKNEYGQLVEHWFEVRCYVDGKSNAKVTFCRTKNQAEKILNKQQSSGKYEMCYIAHLTEEEKIDE